MFWRFWTASMVSLFGDMVSAVALPLLAVTVLQASSAEVGLISAATYAGWVLLGLPAGVLVQRLPLRGMQVSMDLVRAAAVLSIPVVAIIGVVTLTQVLVVAFVISIASVLFDVGNSTFMVSVVSKEELTSRNSLISASQSVVQIGGPGFGGLLVQVLGAAFALLADAVSYLVSALFLARLPRQAPTPPEPGARIRDQIRDGWRFVVRHPVMRPCMIDAAVINFACGAQMALAPLFLVRTLNAQPVLVGIVIGLESVGSLIGAALTPRIVRQWGSARTLIMAAILSAAFCVLMPLSFGGLGLIVFALGEAGFAAGVVITSVLARTHRQTVSPPNLLPRVMATVRFVSWGAIPIGALSAGFVANAFDPRAGLWFMTAVAAIPPLVLSASPIRRLRELAEDPVAS